MRREKDKRNKRRRERRAERKYGFFDNCACGGAYIQTRKDQRYCSAACRQAAYRERRAAA